MNDLILQTMFDDSNYSKLERFAKIVASSDFAPKDYKGKPANVMIAAQYGYELGLKPLQAIQNIAVIGGRPCVWGDASMALVRVHPECGGIEESFSGTFEEKNAMAKCVVKRGSEIIERTFSYEDAIKAQLLHKAGPWQQYPKRMLQMRARGFALRDAFPDVLKGLYLAEELQGTDLDKEARSSQMSPPTPVIEHEPEDPTKKEAAIEILEELLKETNRDQERIDKVLKAKNASSLKDLSIPVINQWISVLETEIEETKVKEHKALVERVEWLADYSKYDAQEFKMAMMDKYQVSSLSDLPKDILEELICELQAAIDPNTFRETDINEKRESVTDGQSE
jgi:hypothetical protein